MTQGVHFKRRRIVAVAAAVTAWLAAGAANAQAVESYRCVFTGVTGTFAGPVTLNGGGSLANVAYQTGTYTFSGSAECIYDSGIIPSAPVQTTAWITSDGSYYNDVCGTAWAGNDAGFAPAFTKAAATTINAADVGVPDVSDVTYNIKFTGG